ncbi:MAG: beta-eliminating lyase-related protein [Pseudomonadota bacterium]
MTGILSELDIKRTINACGIYTDLGGSRLSPGVVEAMLDLNRDFVQLGPLLDETGKWIAKQFDAEAARVTPGAAAAIMLGTAACLAGLDGDRSEQLPDTTGMKPKVLIQSAHRYKYDRQVSMTGAVLTEIGSQNGTRADQFVDALAGDDVCMITHPAHLDGKPGTLPLEEVVAIARAHNVPVLVDAAYMVYPTELIGSYIARGADLVTISAKYYLGPNSGGFIMGRRDLINAVSNVHFTAYETGAVLKYGRPLKMDRQTIVAVVVALDEWLKMDHEQRYAGYARQVERLRDRLSGLPGLTLEPKCFTMEEDFADEPVNALLIMVDEAKAGMSAAELNEALFTGAPCIAAIQEGDKLAIVMDVLRDEEVDIIGRQIRESLGA